MSTAAALRPISRVRPLTLLSPYVAGYAALYVGMVWLLQRREGVEVGEMLFALPLFGIIFPAITWWVTRRSEPLPVEVRRPGAETLVLLGYLALSFGWLIWGVPWVKTIGAQPQREFAVLGTKLLVWVLVPGALVWAAFGYRPGDLAPLAARRKHLAAALVLSVLFILLQTVVGQGLRNMAKSGVSPWLLLAAAPVAFAWLILEVGVVEEFFFRALLQTRIAHLLRSETAGVVLASVLFGLVHAPGYYLRAAASQEAIGAAPSLLMAAGYAIVVTSTAGLFLAVLWSRTKNFAAVVLVHAAGDLVPNLLPLVRAFLGQ